MVVEKAVVAEEGVKAAVDDGGGGDGGGGDGGGGDGGGGDGVVVMAGGDGVAARRRWRWGRR